MSHSSNNVTQPASLSDKGRIELDGVMSLIGNVITLVPPPVVVLGVMCPIELIMLQGTKGILFPLSQDVNLFWLVILL